jgi:microcystin-dependent protein
MGEKGSNGKDGRDATFPSGIVVASVKRCALLSGEWFEYEKANGRFLLGVGKGPLKTFVGLGLLGGAERHQLSLTEVPKHNHLPFNDANDFLHLATPQQNDVGSFGQGDGFGRNIVRRDRTENAGGSKPHNNMPPYVALYFCKKR